MKVDNTEECDFLNSSVEHQVTVAGHPFMIHH